MSRKPQLMSLLRMRDIFEPQIAEIRKQLFIDDQLVLIHGTSNIFKLIIRQDPPFTIDDRRMGIVLKGEACINLNLVDKHLHAGTIVYLGPGSIISPVSISPDFEIYGFGVTTDVPLPFAHGQLPQAFNGQVRDFQILVNETDFTTAQRVLDILWHVVHQKNYSQQVVASLIATQMHHYDNVFRQYTQNQQNSLSREQTIFDRFIYLVNQYATHEHQIPFYASHMCLTERYLGTVIRQTSGTTAKEWIDRALVTRIKAELRHTDKTIAQIADEMNFPNPSFFSKYFKRLTGITPAEFRKV